MGSWVGGQYLLSVWERWAGVKPGRAETVIWVGGGSGLVFEFLS